MRISDRDLELLSTYLDGRLDQTDQARLETRLQKDSNLREAFEQLRRTRLVLRSLPRIRAPRNYTLSPRTVPSRTVMPQSYPVLRLVTALASFLFVFALLGDFLFFRTADQISRTSGQAPAAVVEAPLMAQEEATASEEAAAPEESTEMQAMEAPAEPEAGAEPGAMLEAAPVAPGAEADSLDQAKQAPSIQAEARASVTPDEPARVQLYSQWSYLRAAEVALAVIAVIAGVLALYQRRRLGVLAPPK